MLLDGLTKEMNGAAGKPKRVKEKRERSGPGVSLTRSTGNAEGYWEASRPSKSMPVASRYSVRSTHSKALRPFTRPVCKRTFGTSTSDPGYKSRRRSAADHFAVTGNLLEDGPMPRHRGRPCRKKSTDQFGKDEMCDDDRKHRRRRGATSELGASGFGVVEAQPASRHGSRLRDFYWRLALRTSMASHHGFAP